MTQNGQNPDTNKPAIQKRAKEEKHSIAGNVVLVTLLLSAQKKRNREGRVVVELNLKLHS